MNIPRRGMNFCPLTSPLSIFEKYLVYLKNKNMVVLPTLS